MSERALDGLRQVMAVKSRAVLPYLIPQLTAPPINTKVLAILASVAGDALTKYLHKILPALLKVVASPDGECVSRKLKTSTFVHPKILKKGLAHLGNGALPSSCIGGSRRKRNPRHHGPAARSDQVGESEYEEGRHQPTVVFLFEHERRLFAVRSAAITHLRTSVD
mgnify:CR=1 FL=1